MRVVRKYPIRKMAQDAADYLMSRGIPSTIYGDDAVPQELKKFQADMIELAVTDNNYDRADQIMTQKETGSPITLPKLDFIKLPWEKVKAKPKQ